MRGGVRRLYSIFFRSVWQMPQASTRTRISPGPIAGIGTCSTDTTLRPLYTAAFMVGGTVHSESAADNEPSYCTRCHVTVLVQSDELRKRLPGIPHCGRQN